MSAFTPVVGHEGSSAAGFIGARTFVNPWACDAPTSLELPWQTWSPLHGGPGTLDYATAFWPTAYAPRGGLAAYENFQRGTITSSRSHEKPNQSYIGLIAEAILSSPEKKLVLSDIYNFILTNWPYFNTKGTGWRNSVRHNLSLNDCFVKTGRSPNGKGHFWTIGPAYYEDFCNGDYGRRSSGRKVSKYLKMAKVYPNPCGFYDGNSGSFAFTEQKTTTRTFEKTCGIQSPATDASEESQNDRKTFDVLSILHWGRD